MAEAVVEGGVRPFGVGDADSLAARGHVLQGGVDHGTGPGLVTAQCGQAHGAVGRQAAPGRFFDRLQFVGQRRRAGQITGEQQHVGTCGEGQRQLTERAGLPRQSEVPGRERLPTVVVPEPDGRDARQIHASQFLLGGHAGSEVGQGPAQDRDSCGIPDINRRCRAVEKEIGSARGVTRRRCRARCPGHLKHVTAGTGQASGEDRAEQRIQVGRTGEIRVDGPEPLGRPQQQRGGITTPAGDERELGPHHVDTCLLEVAELPGFGHGQQLPRHVESTCLDRGPRGVQGPAGPPCRVEREQRRLLQERGCRGRAAACPGPPSRVFEFGGDVLVRSRGGLRAVPGTPVGIEPRIGGLGQGAVRGLSVLSRRRAVRRRAGQRMAEPYPGAELDQAGLGGGCRRVGAGPESAGCPPHQGRVAGRVGRRDQQQPPGLLRKGADPP